jgi:hypothetical protein
MTNDLTPHEPEAVDDGFHGSLNSGRLIKGSFLKWNDTAHWIDRDGISPPSPLLVVAIDEVLQKWKNNKADIIREKPLPDPAQLNATVPQSEWERGLDGKARKPWAHTVIVYLVDLNTGGFFTYASPTIGAHIAHDWLNEAVITMRALRGTRVMPIVNLDERPMKTDFGMRRRPHFAIIGWKAPGSDTQAVPAKPPVPQLTGPAAAAPPASVASAPASAPTGAPASPPVSPRQPKPAVNLATETLATMSDVKPAATSEILDDELPW